MSQTVLDAVVLVLLMQEIYDIRVSDGLRWHRLYKKFQEDWCRGSCNIKVFLNNFRGCNVGVNNRGGSFIHAVGMGSGAIVHRQVRSIQEFK
jgi:hypothetical protein